MSHQKYIGGGDVPESFNRHPIINNYTMANYLW